MKQRFQRRIYKNLLHSFNLFVKRRWLLILDLVTGSLKWLNLFKWIVYFTLTFHILRTILAALAKILISNGDIGGLGCVFVFYLGFFSRTFTNHMTAGEGGGHFFNSSLPLSPVSQTLSRAITAESSPLHIASSRIRTGNLWSRRASR